MTSRTNIAASFLYIETRFFSVEVVPKKHLVQKESSTFVSTQTGTLPASSVALATTMRRIDERDARMHQSEKENAWVVYCGPADRLTGTLNSIQPIEEPKSSGAGNVENGLA
jgi:hypothetical protein